MEKEQLHLSETPLHEERTWESGGITVLRAAATLPRCGEKGRRARRFDHFYRQYARAYFQYCEAELFPRAAETMRSAMERSAPWRCAEAKLTFRVTFARGGVLSLYTEGDEVHLPPLLVLRRAETWDLRRGLLLELADFFPPKTPVKRLLVRHAQETAAETGEGTYYPDCRTALRRAFSNRNFYLAEDGLHWFYPMYTVAPRAMSIPDFCLPWGAQGLVLPPEA